MTENSLQKQTLEEIEKLKQEALKKAEKKVLEEQSDYINSLVAETLNGLMNSSEIKDDDETSQIVDDETIESDDTIEGNNDDIFKDIEISDDTLINSDEIETPNNLDDTQNTEMENTEDLRDKSIDEIMEKYNQLEEDDLMISEDEMDIDAMLSEMDGGFDADLPLDDEDDFGTVEQNDEFIDKEGGFDADLPLDDEDEDFNNMLENMSIEELREFESYLGEDDGESSQDSDASGALHPEGSEMAVDVHLNKDGIDTEDYQGGSQNMEEDAVLSEIENSLNELESESANPEDELEESKSIRKGLPNAHQAPNRVYESAEYKELNEKYNSLTSKYNELINMLQETAIVSKKLVSINKLMLENDLSKADKIKIVEGFTSVNTKEDITNTFNMLKEEFENGTSNKEALNESKKLLNVVSNDRGVMVEGSLSKNSDLNRFDFLINY